MTQGLLLSFPFPEECSNVPESLQWGLRPQPHSIQIQLLMESQALERKEIGLKGNECDILRQALQCLGLWVETWLRFWPPYSLKSPLWDRQESCWGALTSKQVAAEQCKVTSSVSCWGLELLARSIDSSKIAWCGWTFHLTPVLQLHDEVVLPHCYICGTDWANTFNKDKFEPGGTGRLTKLERLWKITKNYSFISTCWSPGQWPSSGIMFNIEPQYQKSIPVASWK